MVHNHQKQMPPLSFTSLKPVSHNVNREWLLDDSWLFKFWVNAQPHIRNGILVLKFQNSKMVEEIMGWFSPPTSTTYQIHIGAAEAASPLCEGHKIRQLLHTGLPVMLHNTHQC